MKRVDLECPACERVLLDLYVNTGEPYPACACGAQMVWLPSMGATVRPDDIPGGVLIEHGICNADGTPKRYYSRSAIKLACAVKGVVPFHDVYSEQGNRTLEDARHRDDFLKTSQAQREKRWRDEARAETRLARDREAAQR